MYDANEYIEIDKEEEKQQTSLNKRNCKKIKGNSNNERQLRSKGNNAYQSKPKRITKAQFKVASEPGNRPSSKVTSGSGKGIEPKPEPEKIKKSPSSKKEVKKIEMMETPPPRPILGISLMHVTIAQFIQEETKRVIAITKHREEIQMKKNSI